LKFGGRRAVRTITNVFAHDPNDKNGPVGFGPQHFVPNGDLDYTIYFENDPAKANAPAQVVTITDQLDASLDWTTFQFGLVTFGTPTVVLKGTPTHATQRVFLAPLDVTVDVTGDIDPQDRYRQMGFPIARPAHSAATTNPLAGFLPPNVTKPQGEGH